MLGPLSFDSRGGRQPHPPTGLGLVASQSNTIPRNMWDIAAPRLLWSSEKAGPASGFPARVGSIRSFLRAGFSSVRCALIQLSFFLVVFFSFFFGVFPFLFSSSLFFYQFFYVVFLRVSLSASPFYFLFFKYMSTFSIHVVHFPYI